MTSRIAYIDYIKALAITLVVVGHIPFYFEGFNQHSLLMKIIYAFHMPLFMFVSGYFALNTLKKPFYKLLSSKIRQLLFPAVFCGCVSIFIFLISGTLTPFLFRSELIGSLWFLKSLFFCVVYFYVVCRWIPFRLRISIPLSIVILVLLPKASFLQFNYLYIYYCLGAVFQYYRWFERSWSNFLWGGSISLFYGVYGFPYFQSTSFVRYILSYRSFFTSSGNSIVWYNCLLGTHQENLRNGYLEFGLYRKYRSEDFRYICNANYYSRTVSKDLHPFFVYRFRVCSFSKCLGNSNRSYFYYNFV